MSFSTFNQFPEKSNELVFIDVDPKPSTAAVVKDERPSSPEDKPKTNQKPGAREKLSCSECPLTTYSTERMTRHMRRHRGEDPFQCQRCAYTTYNSTLFEEHNNIHKGIKPYKCNLCDYRSVSKKYTKKHESRHVTCAACGHVARDVRLLRRHRARAGCRQPDSFQGKYTCEKCNVFYFTPECLKQHIKQHKPCPECGESYSTLVLQKHRKNVHGIKNQSQIKKFKFKCDVCEWKSSCHQKILLHLIHHPGQTVDDRIDVTPLVKAGILSR